MCPALYGIRQRCWPRPFREGDGRLRGKSHRRGRQREREARNTGFDHRRESRAAGQFSLGTSLTRAGQGRKTMREYRKFLEQLRRRSNEVENDLIDELLAGRIGRREFMRHGTVLGMSAPALAAIASAGVSLAVAPARAAAGGTIRIAQTTPSGAIDPVTVPDSGGVIMLCQTGEYLCLSAGDLRL